MKIGYIGWFNPQDKRSLSGTPYKICKSLESMGYEIKWIPVKQSLTYRLYSKYIAVKEKILGKNINVSHSILGAMLQSKTIDKCQLEDCDILFAPFASEALYCLKTEKPIIYLSDATYNIMVDYYFKNLSESSVRQGNRVEQRALDSASSIIVSSDWTYNSVINDYHQPQSKVHVIEFGANIDDKDIIVHKFKFDGHLNLLFLGVDWYRKGGQIAVDTCKWLNENGIPATLYVVGIKDLDKNIKYLPYVKDLGFLNKNIPEQYCMLVDTIKKCHCLLLPTLAECAGIAFCESSANGLPVFSHDTGGVKNYVYDGKNGYLLPVGSEGSDFGKKIKACLISGELERMSETAKLVYNEKLNWNVWAKRVNIILEELLK